MLYTIDDPNNPKLGTLTVEGNKGSAISSVEVVFPIEEKGSNAFFPGLYGHSNVNLGGNDVLGENGNILCNNCTDSLTWQESYCTDGKLSEAGLKEVFGANKQSTIEGDVAFGELDVAVVPSLPGTNTDLGTINSSMTLPDTVNHSPDADGIYHYKVNAINLTGSKALTITTGEKVYLYVENDIKVAGTAGIGHEGTLNNFRIYGNPQGGAAQDFLLNGGSSANTTNAFVYAPTATVSVNGSAYWKAVVWADVWDGANGTKAHLTVPDNADTALAALKTEFAPKLKFYGVDPLNQWSRTVAQGS